MAYGRLRAAGYLLAGGQSSRMGTDKALVRFEGRLLVEHGLALLGSVCASVSIAGGSPTLAAYAPLVPDSTPFQGPLGGIVAALRHSPEPWNLFLPIDTPSFPIIGLEALLSTPHPDDAVAILSEAADHVNPLIALYHRRALPTLAAELAAGRLRVRSAIEAAGPVTLAPFLHPDQQSWFRNLNTPADLVNATQHTDDRR